MKDTTNLKQLHDALVSFIREEPVPKRNWFHRMVNYLLTRLDAAGFWASKKLDERVSPLEKLHMSLDILKVNKQQFRDDLITSNAALTTEVLGKTDNGFKQ